MVQSEVHTLIVLGGRTTNEMMGVGCSHRGAWRQPASKPAAGLGVSRIFLGHPRRSRPMHTHKA